MLNDLEISPTKYMLSFLKQRGWQLPPSTIVIPNVVPDAEQHALTPSAQKKVHTFSSLLSAFGPIHILSISVHTLVQHLPPTKVQLKYVSILCSCT